MNLVVAYLRRASGSAQRRPADGSVDEGHPRNAAPRKAASNKASKKAPKRAI